MSTLNILNSTNSTNSTNSFHVNIKQKLKCFIEQNKIPHILFHGPSGSGKRTLVYKFIEDIYNNDKELIKNYTLFADCAQGKGIKFIREDLKFFAKTNINTKTTGYFKTILLTNADKLTTDAQSALRRCIEIFSHNTRFFIIVENKYSLLKPILSRLCELYIETPDIYVDNKHYTNFNTHNTSLILNTNDFDKTRDSWLEKEFKKLRSSPINNCNIVLLVNKLYEKSYSGLDLMNYIENEDINVDATNIDAINIDATNIDAKAIDDLATRNTNFLIKKYKLLMLFHKVKAEFRNEKLLMIFILTFYFVRSNSYLENISSM